MLAYGFVLFGLVIMIGFYVVIKRRDADTRDDLLISQESIRIENMLKNSVGWGYEESRQEARRVMDALHPDLEFIYDQTRELEYGWVFYFATPTKDPDHPWEYLVGCSNDIFVNRHTGKVEPRPSEIELMDWMDK